ncbi:MAG: DUF6430 domain-containing protein [Roseiflexaceae bacterium]|nr:DUF6430 domain-containing protein [Roseiflexaceae bacterium]
MSTSFFFMLLKPTNLWRIATTFVGVFGLLWLFVEPAGLFFPDQIKWGWSGYITLVCLSVIAAIAKNLPHRSISRSLSSSDAIIEIKIGDLFDQTEHLVIGANDVFDTELGDVIRATSVQGQFLSRIYHGDQGRLDADIEAALEEYKAQRVEEKEKKRGKIWRYPIGTTVSLGAGGRRFFLPAYGRMGNDLSVKSTADDIWLSLSNLWQQIRLKGHGLGVAIPIVGSDLARTNLPRMTLCKLIVLSFVAASKEKFVTKKLTIMVYPDDIDSIDFAELEDFLNTTCL